MRTLSAYSIGHIAFNVRASVVGVERIAGRLHLEPVMVLDGVKHYSDEQIEKIRTALDRKGAKR